MKINKGFMLKFSFLFVFIIILSTIRISNPIGEFSSIESETIPLGTMVDIKSSNNLNSTDNYPLYQNSEIKKIVDFEEDGYIVFSKTSDSLERIKDYYLPYINQNNIITMQSNGRFRVIGKDNFGIFIITSWNVVGEDGTLSIDTAKFKNINTNEAHYNGAFIVPSMENIGLYNTSATIAELVNYYAKYSGLSDVLLVNYESFKGEAIILIYDNGVTVTISNCERDLETQVFTCQLEIKISSE